MIAKPNRSDSRWPLRVFYDGACPVCDREMRYCKRRDRAGRLMLVDISAPQFVASDYGLDPMAVDEVLHVRTADGQTYRGVDGFVAIWEAVNVRPLVALARMPGVLPVMAWAYRFVARNRRRFGGHRHGAACRAG